MIKRLSHLWLTLLALSLAITAAQGVTPRPAAAAVTLLYFRATPGDGQVLIEWATASELDNVGFYVQRLNTQTNNYQRISESFTPAYTGFSGGEYDYTDKNLVNGTTYTYRLESIDTSYQSDYSNPVTVVPVGPQPSTSPTATRTITPTATRRSSGGNTGGDRSNKTPTLTPSARLFGSSATAPAASATLNPQQAQATASAAAESQGGLPLAPLAEPGSGGTATLIPLPTIVMEFPAAPTERQVAMQLEQGRAEKASSSPDWGWLPRAALAFIVVAVWLILGSWFYLTFRQSL